MVSPELLRRYVFFAGLSEEHLKEIAMIADEARYEKGAVIFEEGDEANSLFILETGNVDLFYRVEEPYHPKSLKEFHAGEINPGEAFGISSLVAPHILNATARASKDSTAIVIRAPELRQLIEADANLGCKVMTQIARTLKERLAATRVQLAAAWAK